LLKLRDDRIDTNIILCDVDSDQGTANELVGRLHNKGLMCLATGKQSIRLVTHLNVSPEQVEAACEIIRAT